VIDLRAFSLKEGSHLLQDFFSGDIFFTHQPPFGRLTDLAIDAVIGADLGGNEINPKRSSQSP
jgi:hypothetical protein